jgi:hypothetical protein
MKLDGPKLRRKREDGGHSIEDIVEIVRRHQRKKITVGTISNAENSKSILPANAKKICTALGVEISEYRLPMEGNDDAAGKGGRRSRTAKRSLQNSSRVA